MSDDLTSLTGKGEPEDTSGETDGDDVCGGSLCWAAGVSAYGGSSLRL